MPRDDLLDIQINFGGIAAMNDVLLALPKSVGRRVLGATLRWAAKPVRSGLRASVPVRTGEMRRSIKIVSLKPFGDQAARIAIGPTKKWWVAWILEKGSKFIDAMNWAQPVWDGLVDVVINRFNTGVSRSLMREATRLSRKAQSGKLTIKDRQILGI